MPRLLRSDHGAVYVIGRPVGWQVGSKGLKPGAVYLVPNSTTSTTYVIGVVPGVKPAAKPAAPVLISVTPPALLKSGGGHLPLSKTGQGLCADQLFVNGDLLCVAS